jgi:hypothetical protein
LGPGGYGVFREAVNQVCHALIEQLAAALRQQSFDLLADVGIGAVENRYAVLARGMVQFLDLLPAPRRQDDLTGIDGGWYYDADSETLYTALSRLRPGPECVAGEATRC